jgi:hypothetical protein
MAIKIEDQSTTKLPGKTQAWIENMTSSVPREHLRGLEKIRLVDVIQDARLKYVNQSTDLPGLYHPRQGVQPAWIEVAMGTLLPSRKPFYKRLMPRLSFKGNLAAVLFSLIGQHYYLTLRHSIKKTQLELSVRNYTDKHLRVWHQRQHGLRSRLFKPFQPTLERWGRSLQKRAVTEQKKRQSTGQ